MFYCVVGLGAIICVYNICVHVKWKYIRWLMIYIIYLDLYVYLYIHIYLKEILKYNLTINMKLIIIILLYKIIIVKLFLIYSEQI